MGASGITTGLHSPLSSGHKGWGAGRMEGLGWRTQMVKNLLAMWQKPKFDPWVRKIPWRKEWLSIPVFLPGEFH